MTIDQLDLEVAIEAAQHERPPAAFTPRREITVSNRLPATAPRPGPAELFSKATKPGCRLKEGNKYIENNSDDDSGGDFDNSNSPTPKPREGFTGSSHQIEDMTSKGKQAASNLYQDTEKY